MKDEKYKPVPLNTEDAIKKAKQRPGFSDAWEKLEEEYLVLDKLLSTCTKASPQIP
jgi:hypothetical protein